MLRSEALPGLPGPPGRPVALGSSIARQLPQRQLPTPAHNGRRLLPPPPQHQRLFPPMNHNQPARWAAQRESSEQALREGQSGEALLQDLAHSYHHHPGAASSSGTVPLVLSPTTGRLQTPEDGQRLALISASNEALIAANSQRRRDRALASRLDYMPREQRAAYREIVHTYSQPRFAEPPAGGHDVSLVASPRVAPPSEGDGSGLVEALREHQRLLPPGMNHARWAAQQRALHEELLMNEYGLAALHRYQQTRHQQQQQQTSGAASSSGTSNTDVWL